MKPKQKRAKSQSKSRNDKSHQFKAVKTAPNRLQGRLFPSNLQEEKEKFLNFGVTPQLKVKENIQHGVNRKRGKIRFDLFNEAQTILDLVKEKYGDEKDYYAAAYGNEIDHVQATELLEQYFKENNVSEELKVYWAPDLTVSARMMWRGPNLRYNKPEARKYTLVLKSKNNPYLREKGILSLADHEIGTHFFRMMNDGLQPWFSKRKTFGLRPLKCREVSSTEEGLACLNTVINAKSKLLFSAALIYYIACKAASMSFKELYDHLAKYVLDQEIRWKHVMRVKTGQPDPDSHGGLGHGQCYFEGAVEILHNIDNIDFNVLYSGTVCADQLNRIKRLARTDVIRTPKFIRDMERYKKNLRQIGYVNKILTKPEAKMEKFLPKSTTSSNINVSNEGQGRESPPISIGNSSEQSSADNMTNSAHSSDQCSDLTLLCQKLSFRELNCDDDSDDLNSSDSTSQASSNIYKNLPKDRTLKQGLMDNQSVCLDVGQHLSNIPEEKDHGRLLSRPKLANHSLYKKERF